MGCLSQNIYCTVLNFLVMMWDVVMPLWWDEVSWMSETSGAVLGCCWPSHHRSGRSQLWVILACGAMTVLMIGRQEKLTEVTGDPGQGGAGWWEISSLSPERCSFWNLVAVYFWNLAVSTFSLWWTTGNWNLRKWNHGYGGATVCPRKVPNSLHKCLKSLF